MSPSDELRCLRQLLREVAAGIMIGSNPDEDRTTVVLHTRTWDAITALESQ